MQKYLITEEEVKEILEFLNQRKTLEIKKFFKELNLYENQAIKDLKYLLRNKGKSSILESDIKEIIDKNDN